MVGEVHIVYIYYLWYNYLRYFKLFYFERRVLFLLKILKSTVKIAGICCLSLFVLSLISDTPTYKPADYINKHNKHNKEN